MFPHYQQYFLHTRHSQKSLWKNRDADILRRLFEFIYAPMERNSLYNTNQHYPWSFRLKQQWQKKRIGMFAKTRKANKVVIKTRTVVTILKCCFSVFLNNYSFKNSTYFFIKLQQTKFPSFCCVIMASSSSLVK